MLVFTVAAVRALMQYANVLLESVLQYLLYTLWGMCNSIWQLQSTFCLCSSYYCCRQSSHASWKIYVFG